MDAGTLALFGSVPGTIVALGTLASWANRGARFVRARLNVSTEARRLRRARAPAIVYRVPAPLSPKPASASDMTWSSYFLSFRGRVGRSRIWIFLLFYLATSVLVTLLVQTFGAADFEPSSNGVILMAVRELLSLTIFYAALAVGAKRLHDRNKSAWWLLAFFIAPIMLFVMGGVLASDAGATVNGDVTQIGSQTRTVIAIGALVGGSALSVWAFIELYVLRGTPGENHFGPDPLAQ